MPASKTSKTESIDERILRLLGLEDVFDLDYDTYATLLKEALVKYGVIGKQKIPTEEIELLRDEFKKVKGKTGRFKAKSKKISAKSVTNLKVLKEKKVPNTPKLLPGTAVKKEKEEEKKEEPKKQETKKDSKDSLEKLVSSIRKSVDSIAQSVKTLSKLLDKGLLADKRRAENERRSEKEKGMESRGGEVLKSMVSAVVKPFESIFDKIFRFIFWTLLGNTFFKLLDWFNDPKNQKKVGSIFRFLKDWWPAILTGFLAFATPLGGFIATITGTLIRGLFMLARINPALTAAIALFGAGAAIPMLFPKTVDEQERKTEEAPGTPEEKIAKLKEQKGNLNWFQKNVQGMGSEIDEQIYRLETGETKSYASGGLVRSKNISFKKGGAVRSNSGVRITGAGPDTQLIAAQPGEVVINKKAVDAVGANNLLAINSKYGGPNANKPKYANNIRAARYGGMIRAFEGGGIIGSQGTVGRDEPPEKGLRSNSYSGGERSSSSSIDRSIEQRIKRIESQLQAQKALASGRGVNIKGVSTGLQLGTGFGAKYMGRDSIVIKGGGKNFSTGIGDNEITLGGIRYFGMKRGGDVIYVAQDSRDRNSGGGMFQPGGMFGGPRMSARMDYAASKNRYYSSSDQKTYANYNDALAARKSRLTSLESQQRLNRLTWSDIGPDMMPRRFAEENKIRREEYDKRGGFFGQVGRGLTSMFGTYKDIDKNAAADKASEARAKQAGAAAIGRYYSSSDGKYYKDYAAAEKARKERLAKLSQQQAAAKKKGKAGGGIIDIDEGTGYDLPGTGADRQFLPFAGGGGIRVQPGEKLVALTKDAVDKGGVEAVESINARLDPNSNAWKSGKYGEINPLPSNSGAKMMNLPPEVLDMRPKSSPSSPGTSSEELSTIPPFGMDHRESIKSKYYGIGAAG